MDTGNTERHTGTTGVEGIVSSFECIKRTLEDEYLRNKYAKQMGWYSLFISANSDLLFDPDILIINVSINRKIKTTFRISSEFAFYELNANTIWVWLIGEVNRQLTDKLFEYFEKEYKRDDIVYLNTIQDEQKPLRIIRTD